MLPLRIGSRSRTIYHCRVAVLRYSILKPWPLTILAARHDVAGRVVGARVRPELSSSSQVSTDGEMEMEKSE